MAALFKPKLRESKLPGTGYLSGSTGVIISGVS